MQVLYAAHLPLPSNVTDPLDSAVAAVAAWVRERFSVNLSPLAKGEARFATGRITWSSVVGRAGGLVSVTVDQEDTNDPPWRWRTYVEIGVEDASAWVRVRSGLYSALEGLVSKPRVEAGRPGVVRRLADALDIRLDGWSLGEWRPVTESQVPAYVAFLRDPERRLPVIAMSAGTSGETFLDPDHLTDRLLGLGHVVTVDSSASYVVTDLIGKSLSCFGGAVRVYWPNLRDGDDPYHHRLYMGGTLGYLGPVGVERELFDQLGRAAGLSIDEPDLRKVLARQAREEERDRRQAELEEAASRLASASTQPTGGVDAETWAAFSDEYEVLQARLAESSEALSDAELEFEILREERDEARRQLLDVVHALAPTTVADHEGTETATAAQDAVPPTVEAAVKEAQRTARNVVYLQGAHDSAAASGYPDPARVLADLRTIDEIATDWATGELTAGPHTAFKQRCSGYRDGIGESAGTRFRADYEREYAGETVLLEPHIRRGIGAVANILRIYFYFDTTNRKIVVGHVGAKLRDDSNPK